MEIKNMTINLCFKMAQLIPLMRGGGGGGGVAGQPPPHTHLSLYKISEQAIHSQSLKASVNTIVELLLVSVDLFCLLRTLLE